MAFNFPVPTAVGEIFTDPVTGLAFTWSGDMWKMGADSASAVAPYVLKAGDTMTGALLLPDPDPSIPVHATHKKYVDRLISELALYQGTWQVAANVPNLNIPPNAPLNGYAWTAQTADPNIPEMAPLTIPGIGGRMIAALDTIKFSSALNPPTGAYEHIQGPVSVSQMVIADTPPAGAFHGQGWWDSDSGKQYVYYLDADGTGQWVQMSGGGGSALPEAPDDGAMYGRQSPTAGTAPTWAAIVTSATIISDTPPATPGLGQLWWHTLDGTLNIWDNAAWAQTNIEEAPQDGQGYVRQNADWIPSTLMTGLSDYLPLAGGTMTGDIRTAPAARFRPEVLSGAVSAVVFEPTVQGASGQCSIRVSQNTTAKPSGIMEFWTENGNYPADWAFKTTIMGPPGIWVHGTVTSSILAADPAFANFIQKDGEESGADLGQALRWALLEIVEMKAEIAQLKGRK